MTRSHEFLSQYSEEEIIALTGISSSTFHLIWSKYCGLDTPIRRPVYLWWLFQFYKLYPVSRAFRTIHGGNQKSYRAFLDRIYKWERYLARVIDELSEAWDRRRDPENELPHVFGRTVTGSIDTFPIIVNRPQRGNQQRFFYNGKYACHVVKVQGVCDHRGNMIWYSGPHIGVTSDITVFRQNCPPLDPGERLLGDKAYVGEPEYLIPPYKKKRGQLKLSDRKWHFNNVHAWYRATIEHCFAFVKRFRILNSVYRGHIMASGEHLARALKIIMHSNYLHTRDHPQRFHGPMTLDLDDIEDDAAIIIGPIGVHRFSFDDFAVGDNVQIWHLRDWWHGKVTYRSRRHGTLTVRLTGTRDALSGILPQNAKPSI